LANDAKRILERVAQGESWEEVLKGIPGIGPWTISIFRIMILRERDVLPTGDAGLARALAMHYSSGVDLAQLSQCWSPFRSIACWYLWRSLGNPPLD
jgi:DNA-3-methyladenine glycosylase II